MPPRSFLKPATVVVTAAVLVSGFAPTAVAATEAGQARATITAHQQDAAQRLHATLRQATASEWIGAAGDPAGVARLNEAKAMLSAMSIEDIDWVEAFKIAFKILQPFAVAALRYGGPVASAIIEFAGQAVARFPQVGEPLNELFFKPIAALVREWAPRLADLIESIKIDNVPRDEATARIAGHLHTVENLSAEAAGVLAKGLVANL